MAELTFTEKTTGNWDHIFKEFAGSNQRLMNAINNVGRHVPSPFNLSSNKDGFRLDKDYNSKNGLGFDNSQQNPAISGVQMIAFLTNQTENQVSSNIHKLLDGKKLDVIKIKADIEIKSKAREHRDIEKIEFTRKIIKDILRKPIDNSLRDKYLESRGLKNTIPFINKDIIGIDNIYYDKDNNLPAMVSVVRNEDNKIAFLHRIFLNKNGNKANVDDVKKMTSGTRKDAYQRPFYAQVNNPTDNSSKNIHICEGIETAMAVSIITNNKDKVISAINANGITKFEPPENIKSVTIWADYDVKGMEVAISLQNKIAHKVETKINLPSAKDRDFLDDLNKYGSKKIARQIKSNKGKGLSR